MNCERAAFKTVMASCITMLDCVLLPKSAVYMSTPVTTGPRYFSWLREKEPRSNMTETVVNANITAAENSAGHIRGVTGRPVINPACFVQKDWSQTEYLFFWSVVIERFACEVWFTDGWQYSNGCTYEFYISQKARIPCRSEGGSEIILSDAISLMKQAVVGMNKQCVDASKINSTIKKLMEMA